MWILERREPGREITGGALAAPSSCLLRLLGRSLSFPSAPSESVPTFETDGVLSRASRWSRDAGGTSRDVCVLIGGRASPFLGRVVAAPLMPIMVEGVELGGSFGRTSCSSAFRFGGGPYDFRGWTPAGTTVARDGSCIVLATVCGVVLTALISWGIV